MKTAVKAALAVATGCLLGVLQYALAQAQSYPRKPIHLVVPFATGGPTDLVARIVGQKLAENIGQQVVIDNRVGAGGNIGTEYVAKAAPDGYTLLWGAVSNISINPSLYKKLGYSTVTNFAPVILVAKQTLVLLVSPSLPAQSVKEAVAYAKSNPGKLSFGSAGVGTSAHLAGELFKSVTGVDIVHVPYKGTALVYPDLMNGRIAMLFEAIATAVPYVSSAKVRALAVMDTARSSILADVPTMLEAGFSGAEVSTWYAILAPAGTSPEIVARINSGVIQAVRAPEIKARLAGAGVDTIGGTPEELAVHIKTEIDKWARVIKAVGIAAD